MFVKAIDIQNRDAVIGFLSNHFRYDTMNSWNRSTSYANNVKVYRLGLSEAQQTKLFEIMDTEEFWLPINDLLDSFNSNHNFIWQAAFNGRSDGYIVLYHGYVKESEYKSYCPLCGQRNYQVVDERKGNLCGKCHKNSRINYIQSPKQIGAYPGKSTDMDEDYLDWSMAQLTERATLVMDFDKLCDDILEEVKFMIDNCTISTVTYTVEKEKKTLCWDGEQLAE